MKEIVGEALVKRLLDWGVDTVFGLPGDGINGIMEGLQVAEVGDEPYEQPKAFTEAFLRGQPHKLATVATVARDEIHQIRS